MAFEPNNLLVMQHVDDFTMWHYRTEDPSDLLKWTLYFTPEFIGQNNPSEGDMVICNTGTGNITLQITENENGVYSEEWGG